MSKAFKYSSAELHDNPDEDTVELQLKPEHVLVLSRAADNSPEPSTVVERAPTARAHIPPPPREPAHATDIWVSLSVAAVLGMTAVAVAMWPTKESVRTPARAVVPTVSTNTAPPAHTLPAAVQSSPMRFTNPFDPSEVFEFPPGTSEDAARESVAETLLQRALERRAQVRSVRHVHGRRDSTASNNHAAGKPRYS